eukprot:EG_transcript_6175
MPFSKAIDASGPTGAHRLKSPGMHWKRPPRVGDDAALALQFAGAFARLAQLADQQVEYLSFVRRHLHMHPELSQQESETAAFVLQELAKVPGVEDVRSGIAGHGITAVIRGASPIAADGGVRRILLRADMDALPIVDGKDCEYRSQVEGVCHACGHDAHVACLLGATRILCHLRDCFSGEVVLVFQPAEETIGGARRMVAAGVVGEFVPDPAAEDNPDWPAGKVTHPTVHACLSLHVQPEVPAGTIGVKIGDMTASEDDYIILVRGKGGHGSLPHLAINPVFVACNIVVQVQSWLSRNTNPFLPSILCMTTIHGGTKSNVIPDECTIEGTLRTHSEEMREEINTQLPEFIRSLAAAYDAEAEVTVRRGFSGGTADKRLARIVTTVGKQLLEDEDDVVQLEFPEMGAEDFWEFGVPGQEPSIPSLMFWLGCSNEERGIVEENHHAKFDVDEKCLRIGALVFSGTVLHFLRYGFLLPFHAHSDSHPHSEAGSLHNSFSLLSAPSLTLAPDAAVPDPPSPHTAPPSA